MGHTLILDTPRKFLPLIEPARYKGAHGGRGGAKSHQFAEMMVERALLIPGHRGICIREVQKSLRESSKRLIEDKIRKYRLHRMFRIMDSEIRTPDDGVIIFQGMQNHTADSVKSFEGFHTAWCEEAHRLSQRSLDLLRPTIREPGSELWFSWNPHQEDDPIDAFLRGKDRHPDARVIETNYWDNPWFPDVLRQEMEFDRTRDEDKYKHVWEGEYERYSEARVFKHVVVEYFDTPTDVDFLHGADWGFSNDPTVLIRCFIDEERGRLYIDHEAYGLGIETDDLPTFFDNLDPQDQYSARKHYIRADSNRPDTISYLRRHGYPYITRAVKGPNSIKDGIDFLKTYEIVIHPRCSHTATEFKFYSYEVDELTGKVTSRLAQKKNHVIDAARYALEQKRRSVPVGAVQRYRRSG